MSFEHPNIIYERPNKSTFCLYQGHHFREIVYAMKALENTQTVSMSGPDNIFIIDDKAYFCVTPLEQGKNFVPYIHTLYEIAMRNCYEQMIENNLDHDFLNVNKNYADFLCFLSTAKTLDNVLFHPYVNNSKRKGALVCDVYIPPSLLLDVK